MGWVANFEALRDAWKSINLVTEVSDIAANHEKELADYNREQLYKKGQDSTGKPLKQYRSPKYAAVKHEMNPLPGLGKPDLFVTGEFHKSIFAQVRNRSIIFDAADPKVEFLAAHYGEPIFGLQHENEVRAWVEILRPPLKIRINYITGANI
jgi:hypothetical protein